MILLPKYRHIESPRPARLKSGVGGEWKAILYDLNLNPLYESDWSDNLITDSGLDLVHTGNPSAHGTHICIGDSSAPADPAQTSIQSFLAAHDGTGAGNGVQVGQSPPDWEYSETRSRRFNAGTGTGTVREVTLGASNDGTNIFSRIVLPTPINKASDQILDMIYRLTIWPFTNDVLGTSTINGIAYDTITRGLAYGGSSVNPYSSITFVRSSDVSFRGYDGDLGAIDDNGAQGGFDNMAGSIEIGTYLVGSRSSGVIVHAGLDDWVRPLGIRTIKCSTPWFLFQTQFNAAVGGARIPKLSSETMDQAFFIQWDRYTP